MASTEANRHRIVSLIPSASEILCLLGFEPQILGRSHECDYPETLRPIPVCTSSKVHKHASSKEIDNKVREILLEALSLYEIDTTQLDRLAPTHILTQSQCEACAVSLADVQRAVDECIDSRPRIISLQPQCLEDVWRDIGRVATALGVPEKGRRRSNTLIGRIRTIEQSCRLIPSRPSVACIEWIDPLMLAGHWIPQLVEIAGGRSIWGVAGQHSDYLPLQDLAASDPEVIIVMPCGFGIRRSFEEMPALTRQPEWHRLRAVESGSVFLVDGNHYFNRPGPRLVESAEILAEILHPEAFDFGHQGEGWARFG